MADDYTPTTIPQLPAATSVSGSDKLIVYQGGETKQADVSMLPGGTGGGTGDYNDLDNKPKINGHELTGDKTAAELGLTGTTTEFSVGTVETLPAGSSATASITDGDTEHPKLNLGIPKGADGTMTFSDLTEEQKASLKGDKGDTGADGVSPVVTLTRIADGVTLSVTDASGTKTAILQDGADGATGPSPIFSAGTVTTLPAGSEATMEITGSAANPILSLGIPKGADGTVSFDGLTDEQLAMITGPAGPRGEKGEAFTYADFTAEQLAALTGPAGAPGADGETPDLQIGAVETLQAGSSATASITGDAASPRLNLGIPRGEKGDAGAAYTLPVATSSTLGGVMPVSKTADMTQDVGVDGAGRLYTKPGGGGSGLPEVSAADNGKVLAVVSGAWAAAAIDNLEEVAF